MTITIPAEVVFRHTAGETVLMRKGTEDWFALEGGAGPMWSFISSNGVTTVGAVIARMLDDFDVDSTRLTNDVHRVLLELENRQLVTLT